MNAICHIRRLSGLGGRLIVIVRECTRQNSSSLQFLKFDNFDSGAHLGCLSRFIVLITPVSVDFWLVFRAYHGILQLYGCLF